MWGRAFALGCLAALVVFTADTHAGATLERDRDCSDFTTQAAAQTYFDDNGGSPTNNFDALDGDGDGVACESNPCPCAEPGGGDGGPGQRGVRVVSVIDGDTIEVRMKGREEDVRLIGIDTPEDHSGEECGATGASRSMKSMLGPGDRVRLIRDLSQDDRDVYGRLLRYVERRGRDVGRKQIRRGWADVYVFEDPFNRVASYGRSRAKARHADRGVWSRCNGDFHKPR